MACGGFFVPTPSVHFVNCEICSVFRSRRQNWQRRHCTIRLNGDAPLFGGKANPQVSDAWAKHVHPFRAGNTILELGDLTVDAPRHAAFSIGIADVRRCRRRSPPGPAGSTPEGLRQCQPPGRAACKMHLRRQACPETAAGQPPQASRGSVPAPRSCARKSLRSRIGAADRS